VLAGLWIFWRLADVFLLLFGAIVLASTLRTGADFVSRWLRIPIRVSLGLVLLLVALVVGGTTLVLGNDLQVQLSVLTTQLPAVLRTLGDRLGIADLDQKAAAQIMAFVSSDAALGNVAGYTGGLLAVATELVVVIASAVFLAASPGSYVRGVLRLVPRQHRESVERAVGKAGKALSAWLLGQLLTMAVVSASTAIAMVLLRVPAPLALGLIAGVLEFVPYVGAISAAVPAAILALAGPDPFAVFWVIGAYLVIQQVEGNVISPLIQQWAVKLPPVLGLFALVAMSVLFGPLGALLSTPLVVVAITLFQELASGKSDLGDGTAVAAGSDAPDSAR
jgi:predicted PurR-regulated permease PerM